MGTCLKLEDLKVLMRSSDLHNNVRIGYGQLRRIIIVLPYIDIAVIFVK